MNIQNRWICRFSIQMVAFYYCLTGGSMLFGQTIAKSANEQGKIYLAKVAAEDDPQGSIVYLHKALPLFEKANNWDSYIECLNELVTAYYYAESYDSCFVTAQKAYSLAKNKLKASSSGYIGAIFRLGFVYSITGNYAKALECDDEAIELEQKFPKNKVYLSIYFSNAAWIHSQIGDYDEAISYYNKAYQIVVDTLGDSSDDAAYLLREIAANYKSKKQYDISLDYYRKCLKVLDRLQKKKFFDQTRWFVYIEMAEIFLEKGDKEKVIAYSNKALKLNKQYNLIEDNKTWAVLGKLYQQEGNFSLALENYQKQRKTAEDEYKTYRSHPQIAMSISNIASVFAEQKDHATALDHYQQALRAASVGFNSNDLRQNPTISQLINKSDALEILKGKAATLFSSYKNAKGGQQHLEAALSCYQLMADLVQSLRQDYLAEGSKHLLSERAAGIYEKAVITSMELYRLSGKKSYLEEAFAFAEGNKAVLLYESMRDQMAKTQAGIPDSLLDRERELQAEITFLEKKILESQQKTVPDATSKLREWESKLFVLREQRKKLNEKLEKQYPNYFEQKYSGRTAAVANIQKQLANGNMALLEFMLSDETGYVFFLSRDGIFALPIVGNGAIGAQVDRLRETLATPPNGERFATDYVDFTSNAYALYASLLKEGLEKLPREIERLVIVPDEVLNYLPFEVLLTKQAAAKADFSPKKLDYLFEKYAISYHYSATLLANATHKHTKLKEETAFLGYAPNFGEGVASNSRSCAGNQLSNLACNSMEVNTICTLMNGRAVLSNSASTQAFLLDAPKYSILHLATHACIDESNPGLNKIFFTDGNLSQLELSQLRLNAALTVLSACNTGTGKLQHGEGVLSMARSFLLAGSASVLNSLWAVDDCTTADLMLAYYQLLKDGEPKDIALQKARLAYLTNVDTERSHPYYWAAFVQFGDVGPLDFEGFLNRLPMPLTIGSISIMGILMIFMHKKRRGKRSYSGY